MVLENTDLVVDVGLFFIIGQIFIQFHVTLRQIESLECFVG